VTKINRMGEIHTTNRCGKIKIVKYENYKNVSVMFENGDIKHNVRYGDIKRGQVSSNMYPNIHGVAFVGDGKFTHANSKRAYHTWHDMIDRCYGDNSKLKKKSYIGCSVCNEWLNFQNFAKWYTENYYEISGEKMHLDKDILNKHNREYSSESCMFVPESINIIFISRNSDRGDCPLGTNYNKKQGKYHSYISKKGFREYLGSFDSKEEAFKKYKYEKECHIKNVADEYRNCIPKKLYDALCRYNIEITD